jgi:hypothetical protein
MKDECHLYWDHVTLSTVEGWHFACFHSVGAEISNID